MSTKFGDYKMAAASSFGENALQSRILRAEELSVMDFTNMLSSCESPIETQFLEALFEHSAFDAADFVYDHRMSFFGRRSGFLQVASQLQLENWRCDFAFFERHPNGTVTRIVVECDGHEYHERTKQQAARDRSRDRSMTALGWKVMRFTGSEIYKDADACADEIANLIECDSIDDWRMVNG